MGYFFLCSVFSLLFYCFIILSITKIAFIFSLPLFPVYHYFFIMFVSITYRFDLFVKHLVVSSAINSTYPWCLFRTLCGEKWKNWTTHSAVSKFNRFWEILIAPHMAQLGKSHVRLAPSTKSNASCWSQFFPLNPSKAKTRASHNDGAFVLVIR